MTTYSLTPTSILDQSTDATDGTPKLYSLAIAGDAQVIPADPGDYPYTLATPITGVDLIISNATDAVATIDDRGAPGSAGFPTTRGEVATVMVEFQTINSLSNISPVGTATIPLTVNRLPVYTAPAADNVNETATVNIDLSAHISDADGQTVTISGTPTATHGTIANVSGLTFDYTAPAYATSTTDTITFSLTDGLETVASQEYDIAVQESSGLTVGAVATSDGTAYFSGAAHGQANTTTATYWAIYTKPVAPGVSDFIRLIQSELTRFQTRGNHAIRVFGDSGPSSAYVELGSSASFNVVDGETVCVIGSITAGGTAQASGKTPGDAWASNSADVSVLTTLAISGGDLSLLAPDTVDGFIGGVVRFGVAIGVALDPTSSTVRDAIYNSTTDTAISDPTTFQSLLSGGTILVDMYGGASEFNAENNPGGVVDLTGALTGTFT